MSASTLKYASQKEQHLWNADSVLVPVAIHEKNRMPKGAVATTSFVCFPKTTVYYTGLHKYRLFLLKKN
jgi:hypothetical protein